MNGLGDQVFTGSAFALNQNRRSFAGGHLAHEVHQFGHLGRDADHALVAGFAPHFTAQGLHFGAQMRCLESVLDGDVQFVEIDGLAYEVVGSELERGFHVVELGIGGDHNDGASVAIFLELIKHFDAGEVGHAHVKQHEIGRFTLRQLEGRFAGFGLDDVVSPLFALLAERPAHQALVVHDHNFLSRHRCLIYYERQAACSVAGP